MSNRDKLAYNVERTGRVRRSLDFIAIILVLGIGLIPLFFIVSISACASSVSKKASNGGESHFLAFCQPDCEADLECICGVCTKICENDEDCSELLNAICVSAESLESARECKPSDPVEESVCDIGCLDDKDCKKLDEDATCESGYCRYPEIKNINTKPDQTEKGDAGEKSEPGAEAEGEAGLETVGSDGQESAGSTASGGSEPGGTLETAGSGFINPDTEDPEGREREHRLTLIRRYCSLMEQYPCLDWNTFLSNKGISLNQSLEQNMRDCELAMEIETYQSVEGPCRELVLEVIECQLQVDYECPCDLFSEGCQPPTLDGFGSTSPCFDQLQAYYECRMEQVKPNIEITGERATCSIYLSETDPGDCSISCNVDPDTTGDQLATIYGADCDGAPGEVLTCSCTAMYSPLKDVRQNYRVYGYDCSEVAQALADGKCIEILDCCFSWVDELGWERCGCTSDLRSETKPLPDTETRIITCEEVADLISGEVVDLCPDYDAEPQAFFPFF